MKSLLRTLWQDERGIVLSAELVLIASVAVLAMLVGLASYRDAMLSEMADEARALSSLNQSYSITVAPNGANPNVAPAITVAGNTVTVARNFGDIDGNPGTTDPIVSVQATFANFAYADAPDFGDAATIQRTSADGANENQPSPNPVP